jgi:putative transposase
MARQPRFVLVGQPQHVIQRGNNRSVIFVADDDYQKYMEILSEVCERFECDVHAYVLMTNHVHLLMTPQREDGISKVMQSLGRKYVQYFNYQYRRSGTLWEGRYKSTLSDSERYLLTCYRYIELNPVRANMVEHPSQYPWSSYGANARGKESTLVEPHDLYLRLGTTQETRQQTYRELFKLHIREATLMGIREATNKAWVLGNDRFKQEIEAMTTRQVSPKARGGDRRSKEFRDDSKINRV